MSGVIYAEINSEVTGSPIIREMSMRSDVTGKVAEPAHFGICDFTQAKALKSELSISQVSGKRFRSDQVVTSKVSGKWGHKLEFIICAETKQPLAVSEAERCQITGKDVIPGFLDTCEVTGKRVLPSELYRCAATGKKAIRKSLVESSISGLLVVEGGAVRSFAGKFCTPHEAKLCSWTNRQLHPDDAAVCGVTGLIFQKELLEPGRNVFVPLMNLLNGVRSKADKRDLWDEMIRLTRRVFGNATATVEAAELSPTGTHVVTCLKITSLWGFRVRYVGFVYSIGERSIAGRMPVGKRERGVWVRDGGSSAA